ncbi:MAG TPA: response regulator [Candidatus Methylomirabilis sp.]|nr:response regulator [Candidatus Methylomirabilis sp.]
MSKIYILCVEDEPEVLDAVVRDLAPLEAVFPVESARSAAEARDVVARILAAGDRLGLVLCDHIMPRENGVELLVEMQQAPQTAATRKVLLTGQADLEATVKAVNQASLDYYIGKPWSRPELLAVVKAELTGYVLAQEKDLIPFLGILDGPRLAEAIRLRGTARDR